MRYKIDTLLEAFKERELEILRLIASGRTNEEIAAQLFIGVTTVRWYNRQIYQKLGVHHRTLAVARAREHGLLDLEIPRVAHKNENHFAPCRNLPVLSTSFIGREREMAKIQELLKTSRLLTLTGPGGIGKTRLALRIADMVKADYRDGIWFISLAYLRDAACVAGVIARGLQIAEPTPANLVKHLQPMQMLLVIDNFEHLMPAAPLVSELLAAAPQIKILVTSREVLHLSGEREFSIPPLTMSAEYITHSTQELLNFETVRLFTERAHENHSNFQLRPDDANVIAKICTRLDGLPLAIELAAARIKLLTPKQMLTRLERGFSVLGQGPRDAPLRQQTLDAAIDWSYRLLTEAEKTLFVRLSIFRCGWTLSALEAVRGHDLNFDVFDGLSSLLDKSLVHAMGEIDGEPRFKMLETVRGYALNRLEGSGRVQAWQQFEAIEGLNRIFCK